MALTRKYLVEGESGGMAGENHQRHSPRLEDSGESTIRGLYILEDVSECVFCFMVFPRAGIVHFEMDRERDLHYGV